jgi:hypothetical protein
MHRIKQQRKLLLIQELLTHEFVGLQVDWTSRKSQQKSLQNVIPAEAEMQSGH